MLNDNDDPSLSGYGEGWAPACPDCREPLAEDGSCWYCETKACAICGEVVPADKMTDVAEQGRCCPVCAADDSDGVPVEEMEAETVRIERESIPALAAEWVEKLEGQAA